MTTAFEAGFAKVSLKPAMTIDRQFVDDVDARVMALRGQGKLAIIAVADIVSIRGHLALALRQEIASALNVPVNHVSVFSTHNHGARTPEMDMGMFSAAFLEAASKAVKDLAPAEVARVTARPESPLCICRRIAVKDLGAFSFWFGHRDLGNGKADGSHLLKLEMNHLANGNTSQIRCLALGQEPADGDFDVPEASLDVEEPTLFPAAADDLVQALFFRSPEGDPIGSLIRFPAHAITANRGDVPWRSGDYPIYAARRIEEVFGGASIFIPGPSGDQCPIVERKRLQLAKNLGTKIGDIAMNKLNDAEWERQGPFDVSAPEVRVYARDEYLMSESQVEAEMGKIAENLKRLAAEDAPLAQLKRLNERHETLTRVLRGRPIAWGDLTGEQAVRDGFSYPAMAIRIGSSTIAGFPGEPFAEYSLRLRQETGLGDALMVLELANGHISYFPTRAEYALGSYEAADCAYTPDSEEHLLDGLKEGIKHLAGYSGKG
jgi:hypothetical protein